MRHFPAPLCGAGFRARLTVSPRPYRRAYPRTYPPGAVGVHRCRLTAAAHHVGAAVSGGWPLRRSCCAASRTLPPRHGRPSCSANYGSYLAALAARNADILECLESARGRRIELAHEIHRCVERGGCSTRRMVCAVGQPVGWLVELRGELAETARWLGRLRAHGGQPAGSALPSTRTSWRQPRLHTFALTAPSASPHFPARSTFPLSLHLLLASPPQHQDQLIETHVDAGLAAWVEVGRSDPASRIKSRADVLRAARN
jgi:hypothetical protein